MNYTARYQELAHELTVGSVQALDKVGLGLRYCNFNSTAFTQDLVPSGARPEFLHPLMKDGVAENQQFSYPVFFQKRKALQNELIVLLHGLNERNWNKYYTWAEFLCQQTGKAVVLFPIAYHVNRSPGDWSNPRILRQLLEQRKKQTGNDRSLSFANLALSERLSERPLRFFTSGRQSFMDVVGLLTEIREGRHAFFSDSANIDVFAYSIGAFLAQILFLTNPKSLFSNSRLFMLCGGSIFSAMHGCSRSIMDATSYERLYQYYMSDFSLEDAGKFAGVELANSFYSMIAPQYFREQRLNLFRQMKQRMCGVSLQQDKVIPYAGVQQALGDDLAEQTITLLDLPFDYSHENPFPVSKVDEKEVDRAFVSIFKFASQFLAY
jgi:pimeloyl-ACP methyl ester carboxylesterase